MGAKDPALAIDIGGTKIAVGLVEPDGRLLTWAQIPTPRLDAEQLWRTLDSLISRAIAEAHVEAPDGLAGVGCGCGGPMEWPAGNVSPLNIPAWRAFPLRERLQERFPGLPVRLHNDAICVAGGEHWRGGRGGRGAAWRSASTGGAPGGAGARCSAWWSPPASAAAWCSTAGSSTGRQATPAISAMWSSTRTGRRACAAGAAASRRSPAGPRWPRGPRPKG